MCSPTWSARVVHGQLVGRSAHLGVQHRHAEVLQHVVLEARHHDVQPLPPNRRFAERHLVEQHVCGLDVAEMPHAGNAGLVLVVAPLELRVHDPHVEPAPVVLRDDAELQRVDRKGVRPLARPQHGPGGRQQLGLRRVARRRNESVPQALAGVVHVDVLHLPPHRPLPGTADQLLKMVGRAHAGRLHAVGDVRGARAQRWQKLKWTLLHACLISFGKMTDRQTDESLAEYY